MPRKKGTGTGRKGTGVKGTDTAIIGTGTDTGTGTQKEKRVGKPRKYTMSEKALRQRRFNTGSELANTPEEYAYNARVITHAISIQQISENANINDVESLKSAFYAYIQLCMQDGCKVTNLAACAAMGVDNRTVQNWLHNDRRPEYQKLARIVQSTCALSREQLITDGQLNPVIGIFWQRNYDGLRNDTEQIQSIQDNDTFEKKTAAELINKYADQLQD